MNDSGMIWYTYSNAYREACLLTLRTSWIKLKSHLSNSKRKEIPRLRCCWILSIHWDRCGLSWKCRRLSQLTPLMQQITCIISLFYNAPARPLGVFDDFLAIQPVQGNVSTLSYPNYVLGVNAFVTSTRTRLVTCSPVGGEETDTIPNP